MQGRFLKLTRDSMFEGDSATHRRFFHLGKPGITHMDKNQPPKKKLIRHPMPQPGIASVIYQKKRSNYYYYHYNHKGDVMALTDGDGKLAAYYEYDAWGNTMTEVEKSGVDNPYRYSTKEWDKKSGLYYFGARYYWPKLEHEGRVFLSADSMRQTCTRTWAMSVSRSFTPGGARTLPFPRAPRL